MRKNNFFNKPFILFIFFTFAVFVVNGQAMADYYVSPTGADSNLGTINQPFRSIEKAYSVVVAGNLVYFREGRYYPLHPESQICMGLNKQRNGTSDNLIKFWAYPGETPIIDLSQITYSSGAIRAIYFTGDYWHWKGFEVTGLPSIKTVGVHAAFFARDCNYCIFELFKVHDNYGLGFTLSGTTESTGNLVLNCDGYRNQDPNTTTDPYGNADGIHIGTMYGENSVNTVRGCRAWDNSDDGFDCFNNNSKVIFEGCWAFHNGYVPGTDNVAGDGVGFKLGGTTIHSTTVKRELRNCLAFVNKMNGFDENFDNGDPNSFPSIVYNCVSYYNGPDRYGVGYKFGKSDDANVIRNNVSYLDHTPSTVTTETTHDHNSWDIPLILSAAAFQSLDWSGASGIRQDDGSLPDIDFLKPSVGSVLLHKGVDVGLPYSGNVPNVGRYFDGIGTLVTLQSVATGEVGSKNPDAPDTYPFDLLVGATKGDTATFESFVKFDVSSVITDKLIGAAIVTYAGQHNPTGQTEIDPYMIDMYGSNTVEWPDPFTWNSTRSMDKSNLLASKNIQTQSGGYTFGGKSVADWIKAKKVEGATEVTFRYHAQDIQPWEIWLSETWKGQELKLEYETPVSVKELNETALSFYPNPVKDELTLTKLSSGSTLYVYSISGIKVLETRNGTNPEIRVGMSNFRPGIYIVRIILGNSKVQSFKVVKN